MRAALLAPAAALALFAVGFPSLPALAKSQSPFDILQRRIEQTFNKLEQTANQGKKKPIRSAKKKPAAAPADAKADEQKEAIVAEKGDAAGKGDAAVPLPRPRPGAASADPALDRFAAADPDEAGFPGEGTNLPDATTAQAFAFAEPPLPTANPRFKVAAIGGFVEPPEITSPVGKPAKIPLPEPSPVKPKVKLAALPPADEDTQGMNRLAALGIGAKAMPPINESACGVPDPVAVASLEGGGVPFSEKATVNHKIAETLAVWVRNEVEPAARQILNGDLTGLRIAASYDCRTRDSIKNAKLSEHAFGDAIDISAFKIDKKWIEVGGDHPADEQKFLDRIRAAACGPFTTVLGPGSDSYHSSHFHLDLASRNRKGKSRGLYCH